MNPRDVVSSALASALALGLVPAFAQAHDAPASKTQEKCYGIVKAGENDCANLSGTHDCSGNAKTNNAPEEWKYVAKGTCKNLKGMTADEARAKVKPKPKA